MSCDQMNSNSAKSDQVDKQEVEKIVREFILENPDVIIESMKRKQLNQQKQAQQQVKQLVEAHYEAITNDPADPVIGNPEGDVVLVEFFDYNCGYCKHVLPSVKEILETDKNVKIVLKEMPILGESSVIASQVSLAVYQVAPDKYLDFHTAVMNMEGRKTMDSLVQLAESLGIDGEKVRETANSSKVNQILAKNRALAQALNIRGTPAFIIGKDVFPGAVSVEVMKEAIKSIRENN